MTSSSQSHKVILQKRETKQIPGLVSTASAVTKSKAAVTCSLCPESFAGAKELGLHILAAHCAEIGRAHV